MLVAVCSRLRWGLVDCRKLWRSQSDFEQVTAVRMLLLFLNYCMIEFYAVDMLRMSKGRSSRRMKGSTARVQLAAPARQCGPDSTSTAASWRQCEPTPAPPRTPRAHLPQPPRRNPPRRTSARARHQKRRQWRRWQWHQTLMRIYVPAKQLMLVHMSRVRLALGALL